MACNPDMVSPELAQYGHDETNYMMKYTAVPTLKYLSLEQVCKKCTNKSVFECYLPYFQPEDCTHSSSRYTQ